MVSPVDGDEGNAIVFGNGQEAPNNAPGISQEPANGEAGYGQYSPPDALIGGPLEEDL